MGVRYLADGRVQLDADTYRELHEAAAVVDPQWLLPASIRLPDPAPPPVAPEDAAADWLLPRRVRNGT